MTMITVNTLGILLTIFSFLFNILFFWEWKRTEKKYKDELQIECDDTTKLEKNINDILEITMDGEIPSNEKVNKIKEITTYCRGYLSGMKHNLPKK